MALEDIRRGLDQRATCVVGILWHCLEGGKDVTGGIQGSKIGQSNRRSGVAAERPLNQKPRIASLLTHYHTAVCFSLIHAARPLESQEASKRTHNHIILYRNLVKRYAGMSACQIALLQLPT
jgi:hypothetical protein